ncbi:unnamed protein product [Brassica oleracea]
MNINREEALRVKELAQGLMKNSDFTAARQLAMKANKIDPTMENMTHMTMVCDVHCAATEKLFGKELDWYGILQVDDMNADDTVIKKQYRRLALLLHPDKNKLPGAESAFKLIGEAQMILLDKAKRDFYDIKRKAWRNPPAPIPVYKTQQGPRNRAQRASPTNTGGSKTLAALNLSLQVKRSDVEEFFKEAGQVVDVRFGKTEYGRFLGFGMVEFATAREAQKALEFHGRRLLGCQIRLGISHESEQRPAPASAPVYKTQQVPRNRAQRASVKKRPTNTGGSKTLAAFNLSLQVEKSDIEEFFKEAGQVVDVRFGRTNDGDDRFLGFGMVEFATAGEALKALEFHGRPLLGCQIRLEASHARGQRPAYTPQSRQRSGVGLPKEDIKSSLLKRVSVPTDHETGASKRVCDSLHFVTSL